MKIYSQYFFALKEKKCHIAFRYLLKYLKKKNTSLFIY